jgi:hypothetical protein
MANQHLARIEAQLERLFEGAFAHLFRQRVAAQDLLLHLARAFEENIAEAERDDPRPIAPDRFVISLHPGMQRQLLELEPNIIHLLTEHIAELSTSLDVRLLHLPEILIVANPALGQADVDIEAGHQTTRKEATAALERVEITPMEHQGLNPHLLIDGQDPFLLAATVTNLGRSADNDIVLPDPYVSRHHAQIRLRFGAFMLFDNDSQGGTFVNDVRVREHRLQSGDVIVIGKSRLLYIEDPAAGWQGQTDVYPPQAT